MDLRYNTGLSVFYAKEFWHELLTVCINPILTELNRNEWLNTYYIHLSYEQGDHLRLTLPFTNNIERAKRKLEFELEAYFSLHPSHRKEIELPVENLFMDFPYDTYYYHMFRPYPIEIGCLNTAEVRAIRLDISRIITQQLSKSPINQESRFTFLLYMYLGLTKIFDSTAEAKEALKSLNSDCSSLLSVAEQVQISYKANNIYRANRQELQDFVIEQFSGPAASRDSIWVGPWIDTCLFLVNGKEKITFLQTVCHLLKEHISFTSKSWESVILEVVYLVLEEHHSQKM